MNRATRFALSAAFVVLASLTTIPSSADVTVERLRGCAGHLLVDLASGTSRWSPAMPSLATIDVYDNLESPGDFGVASSDPAAVWGDSLTISQTGIVESITITVLNSSSSLAPLTSATFLVTLRDAATHVDIANYLFGATFAGGLPPGFYAMVSITGLSQAALPLDLPTTRLVIEQSTSNAVGSTRLGVVSFTPPTVGTSPPSMYVSATTAFGGVPGFYTFVNGPADPGYDLKANVVDATRETSWGRVKKLYR